MQVARAGTHWHPNASAEQHGRAAAASAWQQHRSQSAVDETTAAAPTHRRGVRKLPPGAYMRQIPADPRDGEFEDAGPWRCKTCGWQNKSINTVCGGGNKSYGCGNSQVKEVPEGGMVKAGEARARAEEGVLTEGVLAQMVLAQMQATNPALAAQWQIYNAQQAQAAGATYVQQAQAVAHLSAGAPQTQSQCGDAGNWFCSGCSNENWPMRTECNRCHEPKPYAQVSHFLIHQAPACSTNPLTIPTAVQPAQAAAPPPAAAAVNDG